MKPRRATITRYNVLVLAEAVRIHKGGLVLGKDQHLRTYDNPTFFGQCHLRCPACHPNFQEQLVDAVEAIQKYHCECGANIDKLAGASDNPECDVLVCKSCGYVWAVTPAQAAGD